mmetsp:Transcript_21850/g.49044  ORF Transcript_21850/g.49044 Transcript_21850/m.49044 type:complete len:167 (+) Transcript_21850:2610-3110(+)
MALLEVLPVVAPAYSPVVSIIGRFVFFCCVPQKFAQDFHEHFVTIQQTNKQYCEQSQCPENEIAPTFDDGYIILRNSKVTGCCNFPLFGYTRSFRKGAASILQRQSFVRLVSKTSLRLLLRIIWPHPLCFPTTRRVRFLRFQTTLYHTARFVARSRPRYLVFAGRR